MQLTKAREHKQTRDLCMKTYLHSHILLALYFKFPKVEKIQHDNLQRDNITYILNLIHYKNME
ncbi:hypothetical protein D1115_19765 [Vibrio alfacsensis]|uniref:Uncharacterized protein n=1 Tax=Vibrio alfacsensis TaxID=1074311 RepID=A0ABN5PIV7_9VIBR|nr:hypothetical protein D1115_19765 [Vibrio alfacsensis]